MKDKAFVFGYTTLRYAIFLTFCARYALRRKKPSSLTLWGFLKLAALRYHQGLGSNVGLRTPFYSAQVAPPYKASTIAYQRIKASPVSYANLYVANVLKLQGLFADATELYKILCKNDAVRDLALTGLGDLLLLQANWAHEFRTYEQDNIAVNPFNLSKKNDVTGWRAQSFAEALDILTDATRVNSSNKDAFFLLIFAHLANETPHHALDALHRYASFGTLTPDDDFLKSRVLFALDRNDGTKAAELSFGSWLGWCVTPAVVAERQDMEALDTIACKQKDAAVSAEVRSTFVFQGVAEERIASIQFDAPYVSEYQKAEILPDFGMILADGQYLIADSLHHPPCDWRLFAWPIYALAADRALLCRPEPTRYPIPGCIFIGTNGNYYHWLLDELPRLSLLRDDPRYADAPIIVDRKIAHWQIETMSRFGIEKSRLHHIDKAQCTEFVDLIAPSHLSTKMVAHPDAVKFSRDHLAAPDCSPKPGKRLYLTRPTNSVRKSALLNEEEVIRSFTSAGFAIVDPSALPIEQQIDLLSDAEVIAAPGGAALTNILYAPQDCKVIELSAADMRCDTFSSLASAIGQKHFSCLGQCYARPYQAWVWTTFDFKIEAQDLKLCLDAALS